VEFDQGKSLGLATKTPRKPFKTNQERLPQRSQRTQREKADSKTLKADFKEDHVFKLFSVFSVVKRFVFLGVMVAR
jgi:hypothetical protein